MNPRLKLTAVPYAFQAGQVAKTDGANRGTLGFGTVANNPNILLPDASGTVCLQSATACGFAPGTNASYVQNGTSLQTNTNFAIQSAAVGSVGGVIRGAISQSADLLQLQDSSGNTNAAFNATGNVLTLGRVATSGTVTQGQLVVADGTLSGFRATVTTETLTADRKFLLPNTPLATTASPGTICVFNGSSSNCPAATGSAFYIQNQNTLDQSADFRISGVGQANTSILTPLLDTATATALNIGTNNATGINLNQNTTLAAGKSLTVTGGISFPASPTEGQIYYRTDTKQLYVYANAKWQADRSTATKIVAASDSQNKEKADYVSTGTADQTTINAAIAALPATGGSV